ncbi:MAG TPA: helix-turn-helix transcriptional regulator [Oculatellaceae cyanobacterium]
MSKQDNRHIEDLWLIAFGDSVSDLRESLGMTQQELADLSGVNRTYISDIERGRRNITLTTMKRLAAALKIEAFDLLKTADRKAKSASFQRRVG